VNLDRATVLLQFLADWFAVFVAAALAPPISSVIPDASIRKPERFSFASCGRIPESRTLHDSAQIEVRQSQFKIMLRDNDGICAVRNPFLTVFKNTPTKAEGVGIEPTGDGITASPRF